MKCEHCNATLDFDDDVGVHNREEGYVCNCCGCMKKEHDEKCRNMGEFRFIGIQPRTENDFTFFKAF
jgi:hypothetical protein